MRTSRQLEKIAGSVEVRGVLKGTASAHEGVVLTTADGKRYRLQRVGGNPFRDAATEALSGRSVTLEGYRVGDVFRFVRVSEEDESPAP